MARSRITQRLAAMERRTRRRQAAQLSWQQRLPRCHQCGAYTDPELLVYSSRIVDLGNGVLAMEAMQRCPTCASGSAGDEQLPL